MWSPGYGKVFVSDREPEGSFCTGKVKAAGPGVTVGIGDTLLFDEASTSEIEGGILVISSSDILAYRGK